MVVHREGGPVVSPGAAATKFFVADASADDVFRYGSDGTEKGSFALPSTASEPRGVASDVTGSTIWVVDAASKAVFVQGPDGNTRGTWSPLGIQAPEGITTDGADIRAVLQELSSTQRCLFPPLHRCGMGQ